MYASLLGYEKSVDLLLKRGANSKLQDNNGHTGKQLVLEDLFLDFPFPSFLLCILCFFILSFFPP